MTGGTYNGKVTLNAGNDAALLSGGTFTGNISLAEGSDTIIINGGEINGDINSGEDGDSITVNDGTITGSIYALTGEDTITFNGGTITKNIQGGQDADTITVTGGTLLGNLQANADDDTITITGGTIEGDVKGRADSDSISISGGTILGSVYGDDSTADTTDGGDTILWSGGTISGGIYGGAGDDTATVCDDADFDGSTCLDGGDDFDTLNFSGITSNIYGANIAAWEKVNIGSGSTISLKEYLKADDINILSGGTIALASGTGTGKVLGSLSNRGTINLNRGSSSAGDTLKISEEYTGSGAIILDVDFSTSTADTLSISGNVAASGTITINDLKTLSSDSSDEILLIEETSDSDKSDESFVLATANQYNGESDLGRFVNSPFIWKLKTSGNNWVLGDAYEVVTEEPTPDDDDTDSTDTPAEPASTSSTSKPAVVSEIPAYVSLPTISFEIVVNRMDTLHQRLGELRNHTAWASADPAATPAAGLTAVDFDEEKLNGWVKTMYSEFNFDNDSNFELDGDFGVTEVGFDRKVTLNEKNTLYLGGYISFVYGDFNNDGTGAEYGALYNANTDIDGKSGGLYATWFNTKGTYIDIVADYMDLEADIEAVDKYSTDGTAISASVEIGHDFVIRPRLIIEPQAQVKITHINWDDFNDGWNEVEFEDHTYTIGRLGVRAEYTVSKKSGGEIKPWIYAGVQDEVSNGTYVNYAGTDFETQEYNFAANLQAGITADINRHLQFYGDAGYTSDFADYDAWRVDAGLRLKW